MQNCYVVAVCSNAMNPALMVANNHRGVGQADALQLNEQGAMKPEHMVMWDASRQATRSCVLLCK